MREMLLEKVEMIKRPEAFLKMSLIAPMMLRSLGV
jgi:hypothetical protein